MQLKMKSDRTCAILGLATVDLLHEDLIKTAMIEDAPQSMFEGHGACSTLSSKVNIAYSLGFISAEDRRDFHLLRKIRNEFAHAVDHDLSFNDDRIANRIRELMISKLFESTLMLQDDSDTLRFRFELAVATLNYTLSEFRMRNTSRPQIPTSLQSAT